MELLWVKGWANRDVAALLNINEQQVANYRFAAVKKLSEYVRDGVTTNHAEGYFAQLKRSIDGTHHAVSKEHLARYLAEFDFRYNTRKMGDSQRMARLIGTVHGRRLTSRPLSGRS